MTTGVLTMALTRRRDAGDIDDWPAAAA